MATLQFTTKLEGVLTNVTSMVLSDPTGTFGIRRTDTGATVVAADTSVTNASAGTYTYEYDDSDGVPYEAWWKWVYGGETFYNEIAWTATTVPGTETGLRWEEQLYNLLHTDAQSLASGALGDLLEYDPDTKPRCVFYGFPPETIKSPLVTVRFNSEAGDFPRRIFVDITAWGGQFVQIQNRIYDLLHEKIEVSCTDWDWKAFRFDASGPVLWDEDFKEYYQNARYQGIVARA